ncbi:MAG: hypothetical protein IIU14_06565 [Ruminococcus sp.]|nr:hypothetical protein [Ruminococcus sp.]
MNIKARTTTVKLNMIIGAIELRIFDIELRIITFTTTDKSTTIKSRTK